MHMREVKIYLHQKHNNILNSGSNINKLIFAMWTMFNNKCQV